MISTVGKYVWLAVGAIIVYSLVIALGLVTGLVRLEAVPLCVALLCFLICLWYTNAYLEVRAAPFSWGLVVNAAGWGMVSLAFLVPKGWHLAFSLLAAGLIATGGVTAWLSLQERPQGGTEG